ncbi:MAG TPA: TetR/AcrR family transcriptional regulator [Pseudonocardiaceae bacterium]
MTELAPEAAKRSRPGGRTALASERVLNATVELIARHGAAAVTYDAVAKLAGASRATIYRKWPRRKDLLRAAITRFADSSVDVPDTGDIRADLVVMLRMVGDTLATPLGRAIVNASMSFDDDDPVRQAGQDVHQERLAALQVRIDRAVARGELPAVDAEFLNSMLVAPVHSLVVRDRRRLTRELAARIVTTVFDGILPRQS